jgi:hypothetical protein
MVLKDVMDEMATTQIMPLSEIIPRLYAVCCPQFVEHESIQLLEGLRLAFMMRSCSSYVRMMSSTSVKPFTCAANLDNITWYMHTTGTTEAWFGPDVTTQSVGLFSWISSGPKVCTGR